MPNVAIPSTYITPGAYIETRFAVGPASTGSSALTALIVGPKTSTGEWTANTLYRISDISEVEAGAGSRSPLAEMARAYFAKEGPGPIYALPYDETSGGSADFADGYVAVSGTATGRGFVSVTVHGEEMIVPVNTGDTATTIGDAIEEAVNARAHLPCTGSNSAGQVDLTAAVKGTSQNNTIRIRISCTSGIGLTVSRSGETLTDGVEGSTTEADNLETALASVTSQRFHLIASSVVGATAIDTLKDHVESQSDAATGNRCRFIVGDVSSMSTVRALAVGRNFERGSIVSQPNSEKTPARLAGLVLAVLHRQELIDPSQAVLLHNFSTTELPPVFDVGDRLDNDDINDMMRDGVTVINSDQNRSYLVKSVTTKSKDSSGSYTDLRVSSTHIVATVDAFADDGARVGALEFIGKKLRDDRKNADGSVYAAQKFTNDVLTPSLVKKRILALIDQYESPLERIQDVEFTKNTLSVDIDTANTNRVECRVNLRVISSLDQFTALVSEVSPG